MSILEFKNVSINYGQLLAVKDVSFKLEENDYACIIGSNGSGKSSVIKSILGLISPSKGAVKLNINKSDIAYVPQANAADRDFPATVFEIVVTGTQKKQKKFPFYTKKDIATANEAIKLLGIEDITKKRIGQLSGGQQQRVMIARAMCKNPKLLILDEPCANLDEAITKEMYNLLDILNKQKGIVIFMASHNLEEIQKHANRILVLDKTLLFDGNAEQYKEFKLRNVI